MAHPVTGTSGLAAAGSGFGKSPVPGERSDRQRGLGARVVRVVWSFPKELKAFLETGRSTASHPCLLTQIPTFPLLVLGLRVPLKGQSSAPAALPCRQGWMWLLRPLYVRGCYNCRRYRQHLPSISGQTRSSQRLKSYKFSHL